MSSREITVESRKSPGSGREEKKAEVRRRILEASKEIFFRDGFMDANLDEIAELAGVAKGTLYRYFDNKAQIYLAVLSRNAKRFEKKLQGALDPQATPIDALIGVILLSALRREPGLFPDLLGDRESGRDRRTATRGRR